MTEKANQDIRNVLKDSCVKHWKLAERLKISETTLVRKLRVELPTEEKEKMKQIIKELEEERLYEQNTIY